MGKGGIEARDEGGGQREGSIAGARERAKEGAHRRLVCIGVGVHRRV